MSKLAKRLAKKIYKQLKIDCDAETFVRTYAGRNQKTTGAPLWLMRPKNNSITMIGSTLPASYLVKKNVSLCAEKCDYGTFIEIFDEEETPTCSECEHYEDHHTSLACATCPVITKVWGDINK